MGVAGSSPWLVGLPLAVSGLIRPLFWLVLVTLVGHHSFMASGSVDDMTWGEVSSLFAIVQLLPAVQARWLPCTCPAKGGVDIVHTKV